MSISYIRIACGFVCTVGLIATGFTSVAQAQKEPAATKKAPDTAADAKADPYKVPETGGTQELFEFIKRISQIQPTSQEEFNIHRDKAIKAIKAAGDKMQKVATPEEKKSDSYQDVMSL